jgi:hypothetical protein
MAISIISHVWQYPHLRDQSQLLIMLALADFSNEHGLSYPAVGTLADRARVTARHARKILSHLERFDLVTVRKGQGIGSIDGQRSNVYQINVGMLLSRTEIPSPNYAIKKALKKQKARQKQGKTPHPCHNDTPPPTPVIGSILPREDPCHNDRGGHNDTPPPVSHDRGTPVIMTPDPSEENHQKDPPLTPPRGRRTAASMVSAIPELPTWSERAHQSILELVEYRLARDKSKYTQMTVNRIPSTINSLGEERFIAAVNNTITCGYQGLVEKQTLPSRTQRPVPSDIPF